MNQMDLLNALIEQNVVPEMQRQRVRDAQLRSGEPVERVILELGLADDDSLFRACAAYLGADYLAPADLDPNLLDAGLIPADFMARSNVLALRERDGAIRVLTTQLAFAELEQSLTFLVGAPVRGMLVAPSTLQLAQSHVQQPTKEGTDLATEGDIERLRALANDGPVVKFANELMARAVMAGASDIHIEATPKGARIRLRVDGALQPDRDVAETFREALVSRLKVMTDLNMSEKRKPQDGRLTASVRGRNIDMRLSTLPTQFGESVVIRILDQARIELDWTALGFAPKRVDEVRGILAMLNGIFLAAGPTGSGKTTTLYTALREMNAPDRKILTVEDPIEYTLDGINQVQVDHKIGMDFANALRAILRQDPDIVLVGEIRDQETAEIAVRAALIGRIVLSTIHTNDSTSAVDRLIDLGVAPYLVAATLRGVLSQRLVRKTARDGHVTRGLSTQLLTMNASMADAISEGLRGQLLALKAQKLRCLSGDADFQ